MVVCKICGNLAETAFRDRILKKYNVQYFSCPNCGYLFTEEPYWLSEAYSNAINNSDTGLAWRNIHFSKIVAGLSYFLFNKKGTYLDFAGGYGLFTRLMRDIGFDFYWLDPYCENIFAVGFEFINKPGRRIEAITAFEVFEHLPDPIAEISKMLEISSTIIFSTELLPQRIPSLDWWYYSFEHGQHISFYSLKTLKIIGDKLDLNVYSLGNFHILTKQKLNIFFVRVLSLLANFGLTAIIRKKMGSKTLDDSILLGQSIQKK